MQAVVLAAGRGTRLRPVTESRSKAMVPVVGIPLVELALRPFVQNGVRDLVMVVGPGDDEIREWFSRLTTLDLSVHWVTQEQRLGMAHALLQAAHLLHDPFFLTACDSLVSPSHVGELAAAARSADAVLSLLDVEPSRVSGSAAVEMDGEVVRRIVEKPAPDEAPSNTVSLPHYVFSSRIVRLLERVPRSERGEFELQDAIQGLIDEGGRVVGVRAAERIQVSTPEDLLRLTERMFSENPKQRHIRQPQVGNETKVIAPVRIESGVSIGNGCEIGPGVVLERGCRIGDDSVIRRSIVLRGARVGDGERIEDKVVVR